MDMDFGQIIFMGVFGAVSLLLAVLVRKFLPSRKTEIETSKDDFLLKRFFLGDFHMVPTFVISVGIFIGFEFLINMKSFSFSPEGVLTISIPFFIIFAVPVWKSANKFKGNGLIALLAQTVVISVLAWLVFLLFFFLTFEL